VIDQDKHLSATTRPTASGKTSFGNFFGLPADYQTSNPINGNATQLPGLPASYR
jgi:hypothetical protein